MVSRCYNRSKFGLLQRFESVEQFNAGCYNRSKFGLLQLIMKTKNLYFRCYNRSKFGLLQQKQKYVVILRVVITVQNSVFYNVALKSSQSREVVITVQNSVFYNFPNIFT